MSTQENREEKPQKLRKKYEKPAVIYLAPLEAMAALCDPFWQSNPYGCPSLAGKQAGYACNSLQS